jgi:hypothetical protein
MKQYCIVPIKQYTKLGMIVIQNANQYRIYAD